MIPDGLLVTAPEPVPAGTTDKVKLGSRSNSAVMVVLLPSVSVQGAVPLHPPPLQPVKAELLLADAVSVTCVPAINPAVQALAVWLQLTPAGELVTWPLPEPVGETVNMVTGKVPILLPPSPLSANQMLLFGPAVIPTGSEVVLGTGKSEKAPAVVIRPI